MKEVQLYTDGACRGNPGPGGWAAILVYHKIEKEMVGGEPSTTNNRMELMAAIQGLQALKEPCIVTLYSDSKYLIEAIQQKWLETWQKENFRRGTKHEVKNIDLWERIASLLQIHEVTFEWVKGHNGHDYNERCDTLATNYAGSFERI